jgi:N-formylmaleamate deformylase
MTTHWTDGEVNVRGARMHYYRAGTLGKPALVLAHGFSDTGRCWEALAEALADDFDIVMPDARGHGLSERVHPGETTDMPADLAAVMRALKIERAVVGGHSMGAMVVAQLGARFPEMIHALILEDPPWWIPEPGDQGSHSIGDNPGMAAWVKSLAEKTAEQLMAECRAEHPTWSELTVRRWCEGKKQLDQNFITTRDVAWDDWVEFMSSIPCPALLITADPELGGIITPRTAERIVELNPCIQVAHIAGVGHHIRFGQEQAYTQAVRAFLQTVPVKS